MSTQTIFLTAGSTSKHVDVSLVQNAGATSPGNPLTGLVYNSAGLTAYYRKGTTGASTAITLATQTVGGAYSSGGFVEISATNHPGQYRFDIPNACIDTAGFASITFAGHASLAAHTVLIIVTAVDLYDPVRMGLTALPNAVAAALGGLFTRGTGAGQINQDAAGRIDVNVEAWRAAQPNALTAGRVETILGAVTAGVISAASFAAGALDAVWSTVARTLTAFDEDSTTVDLDATIRAAVGMAAANLDTQLAGIDGGLVTIDGNVNTILADTNDIQTRIPAALVAGRMDVSVGAMALNVITAAALAADAVTEIQSGLATAAAVTTIDDFLDTEVAAILAAVDTEIAAIKTKTDQLTFTVANQVDSNALSIVGALLSGTGPIPQLGIVDMGTAQQYDGVNDRIRLRAGFAAPDIVGSTVWVYSSTNGLHTRAIVTAWNNTTKDATIDTPVEDPTGTILYVLYSTPKAPASSDVAAVKAKTDQLTFTGSNVNANMEALNGTTLYGDGTTGNEFDIVP